MRPGMESARPRSRPMRDLRRAGQAIAARCQRRQGAGGGNPANTEPAPIAASHVRRAARACFIRNDAARSRSAPSANSPARWRRRRQSHHDDRGNRAPRASNGIPSTPTSAGAPPQRSSMTAPGSRTTSSRPCSVVAPRSSRQRGASSVYPGGQRGDRPCATGRPRNAWTWSSRQAGPPDGSMACPRGSTRSPVPRRRRRHDRRGSRSTRSPARIDMIAPSACRRRAKRGRGAWPRSRPSGRDVPTAVALEHLAVLLEPSTRQVVGADAHRGRRPRGRDPGLRLHEFEQAGARVLDPAGPSCAHRRSQPCACATRRASRCGRAGTSRGRGARQARERSGRSLELLVLLNERRARGGGGDLAAFFLSGSHYRYSSSFRRRLAAHRAGQDNDR